MKRIGTLGYLILGLITTSAFAQSTPVSETTAPATENAQAAQPAKQKKGGKKHTHHAHKKHKKKPADQK